MTIELSGVRCPHPATVELFSDAQSLCHVALGALAGSRLFDSKDALILFGAYSGYQISQHDSGDSWSRIGGELIEFVLGMLLMRLLPALVGGLA